MNTTTRRPTRVATLASVVLVGAGLLTASPAVADQTVGDGGSPPSAAQGWGPDIDYLVYVRKVAMAHDFVALAGERAEYGALLGARLAG